MNAPQAAASEDQVTLIIPTKNERQGMEWFMPRLNKEWYDELIVVDGGSTDGTPEYCRAHGYPLMQQTGRGMPNALDEAYARSTKGIIVVTTPDGNSLPELVPVLTERIRRGYDLAIASRYLGAAKSEDDDVFTAFGNRLFTGLVNLLFGGHYTDALVGYRAYRRSAVEKMRLPRQDEQGWLNKGFFYMNGWELGSSIRACKLRLRVCEVPGDEPRRIGGARKLSIIKNGLGSLLQVIREFFINPMKRSVL